MESHSPTYKPAYGDLVRDVCDLNLEDAVALRNLLNTRIPMLVAEAEWVRQQTCAHPRGRVERSGNWSDFYCPDCHMRVNESEYRSRGAK